MTILDEHYGRSRRADHGFAGPLRGDRAADAGVGTPRGGSRPSSPRRRREAAHVQRVAGLLKEAARDREQLRLHEAQQSALIKQVLACARLLERRGWTLERVARGLDLFSSTLGRWIRRRALREAPRRRRGRKRQAASPEHRKAALRDVLETPRIGARALRRRYPTLTRQEAERIKRKAHALQDRKSLALLWTRPGAV